MNAIAELDLEPIKIKLMHKESGEGWSLERANAVEFEYRRFLTLMKKFPNESTSPLVDVDAFWHYHILDTMKYAADCQAVFGYFLHHFPYIGMRGDDDAATLARLGVRMKQLYEAEFGEPYLRDFAITGNHSAAAYCGMTTVQAAYCGMTTIQSAYCGMTTVQATSPGLPAAALLNAPVASSLYTERPRLS